MCCVAAGMPASQRIYAGPHRAGSAAHSSPLQPCMPCASLTHPTALKQQRLHVQVLAFSVQAVLDEMGCKMRELAWPDHWYFGKERRLADSRYEVHSSRAGVVQYDCQQLSHAQSRSLPLFGVLNHFHIASVVESSSMGQSCSLQLAHCTAAVLSGGRTAVRMRN